MRQDSFCLARPREAPAQPRVDHNHWYTEFSLGFLHAMGTPVLPGSTSPLLTTPLREMSLSHENCQSHRPRVDGFACQKPSSHFYFSPTPTCLDAGPGATWKGEEKGSAGWGCLGILILETGWGAVFDNELGLEVRGQRRAAALGEKSPSRKRLVVHPNAQRVHRQPCPLGALALTGVPKEAHCHCGTNGVSMCQAGATPFATLLRELPEKPGRVSGPVKPTSSGFPTAPRPRAHRSPGARPRCGTGPDAAGPRPGR